MANVWAAQAAALAASVQGDDMTYARHDGTTVSGRCVLQQGTQLMVDGIVERVTTAHFAAATVSDPARGEQLTVDSVIWEVDGPPLVDDAYWVTVPVRRVYAP